MGGITASPTNPPPPGPGVGVAVTGSGVAPAAGGFDHAEPDALGACGDGLTDECAGGVDVEGGGPEVCGVDGRPAFVSLVSLVEVVAV